MFFSLNWSTFIYYLLFFEVIFQLGQSARQGLIVILQLFLKLGEEDFLSYLEISMWHHQLMKSSCVRMSHLLDLFSSNNCLSFFFTLNLFFQLLHIMFLKIIILKKLQFFFFLFLNEVRLGLYFLVYHFLSNPGFKFLRLLFW